MKRITLSIILLIVALCAASGWAQDGDSIKINKDFIRELETAFSTDQPEASGYKLIAPQPLTKELLQEWLGPIERTAASQISIPVISGQELLKATYLWKKGRFGQLKDGTFTGLDVNALSKYFRPKEIRLRRMRKLASNARADMDLFFPIAGR